MELQTEVAVLADPRVPIWNSGLLLLLFFTLLIARCLVWRGFGQSSFWWNFMFRRSVANLWRHFCFWLILFCLFLFSIFDSVLLNGFSVLWHICLYDFFKISMYHVNSNPFCGISFFLFSVWTSLKDVAFAFGVENLDAPIMNSVMYQFNLCTLWQIVLSKLVYLWNSIKECLHLIDGTCIRFFSSLQVTNLGEIFFICFLLLVSARCTMMAGRLGTCNGTFGVIESLAKSRSRC